MGKLCRSSPINPFVEGWLENALFVLVIRRQWCFHQPRWAA